MKYLKAKYPLFVDISGEKIIVVGGGKVAERKIETLLNYGAAVSVIAPDVTERLRELATGGHLELQLRKYREGDLEDAFLVLCATDVRAVNEQVYAEARERGCLVNVADVPELCNFYVPSVVARGPLQIAISTSGAAPTVAKQLRRELSAQYGEEWGRYVSLLGELRVLVLERVPGGEAEHKPIFSLLADSGLYERVAAGQDLNVEGVYAELVVPFLEAGAACEAEPAGMVGAAASAAREAGTQVGLAGAAAEVAREVEATAAALLGDAADGASLRVFESVRTAHPPQNKNAVQTQMPAIAQEAAAVRSQAEAGERS